MKGYTLLLQNTYSIGQWTSLCSLSPSGGHPTTRITVQADPTAIPVGGRARMLAVCECGATQKVLPYARRR